MMDRVGIARNAHSILKIVRNATIRMILKYSTLFLVNNALLVIFQMGINAIAVNNFWENVLNVRLMGMNALIVLKDTL